MRLRLVSLGHFHLDRLTLLPSVVLVLIWILAKISNLRRRACASVFVVAQLLKWRALFEVRV